MYISEDDLDYFDMVEIRIIRPIRYCITYNILHICNRTIFNQFLFGVAQHCSKMILRDESHDDIDTDMNRSSGVLTIAVGLSSVENDASV